MPERLPQYTPGDHASAADISDAKSRPPGYNEAAGSSGDSAGVSGETYVQKSLVEQTSPEFKSTKFTVHATETENFVLLDESTSTPVFYIDNTSSLSKTFVRSGNSTRGSIISTSKVTGPFVREMVTEYESKVKSGTKETIIVADGKFSVVWQFGFKNKAYTWRSHKGIWTLYAEKKEVAHYDTGRSLQVDERYIDLVDVVVSTVFAIFLYSRLSAERRQRALNNISGKSSTPMLGTGLLL